MRVEKLYKVKQENTKTELNTYFFFFLKENRIIVLRPHRMETSSWQEKKMLPVLNFHCFLHFHYISVYIQSMISSHSVYLQ